jgi:putative membrane protein
MKVLRGFVLVLAAAGLATGCGMAQRAMPGTMSDNNVVGLLHTIDTSEIEAAQLATQKAQSPEVRNYATRLVDEHIHMMMIDKNRQVAEQTNIQPEKPQVASTMKSTHEKTMQDLRNKSGHDFDRAYIDYQVKMHEEAVNLVENTAGSADNQRLKQHLMQTRPDLQSHLAEAKTIQRQLVAAQKD